MNKKIFLLLSMALATSAYTMCAKIAEDITDEATDEALEGKKAHFNFPAGDTVFSFGGDLREEFRLALNPCFLNDALPDDFVYFRNTVELKSNFAWGEQKYGHKAVEMLATLRHKSNWGDTSSAARTTSTSINIFDKVNGGNHSHGMNYPLIWVKELWGAVSLNAAFGLDNHLLQNLKIGAFSFGLGRGIALGTAYGLNKGFLGIYSTPADHCAPGILLSGELIKDTLSYEAYFGMFESNSGSAKQTLAPTRANQIGKRANPFAGKFNDDIILAAQAHLTTKLGNLSTEISPYILYNSGKNKKIETPSDSDSYLSTAGINLECEASGFEFGGEFAFNMGYQDAYSIDRNNIILVNDTNSYPIAVHSKVSTTNPGSPYGYGLAANNGLVNAENGTNAAIKANNSNPVNGGTFSYRTLATDNSLEYPTNTLLSFKNADDRVRPYYRNTYTGYMMVADAAYTFKKTGFKVATAAGLSSGDANPNDNAVSASYKGFVSLNEVYSGNQVQSIMILGNRDVQRPLSLSGGDSQQLGQDTSFSDIIFVGGSAKVKHPSLSELTVHTNVMAFWKHHQSAAWDKATNKASTSTFADPYMGTELNTKFSYELFEDTKLFGAIACFIPGQYYKDIAGVVLKDDIVSKLEVEDPTGLDATKYRLSYDKSYYFNLGINFVF